MRKIILLLVVLVLAACGEKPAPQIEAVSYNIDPSRITVSGVSSGAYMAGQLHIAYSHLFNGLAMVAGGPYYCAEGSLTKGIGPCVKGGDVGVERLLVYAEAMAETGKVDELANLADDSVWIFHGVLDEVVSKDPSDAAVTMYTQLITPYINACDYDAAGEMLTALYGELDARADASGELRVVQQPGFDDAQMLEHGFLYVPELCASGESCGLHVAMHGCSQSAEFVSDAFAAGSGFNEWAESNKLLVLYPQVASSKIMPLNPYGCWDWWGYTNENYATKDGPQIAVIKGMIDALAGTTL